MKDLTTMYDERMNRDLARELYDYSDFYNWGYWKEETQSAVEASENLVEMLLSFLPDFDGSILDVGCGQGATARYLLRYYNAHDIFGINISESQLARCRVNNPGCEFLAMDAASLAFDDQSFDNAICVEAVFHFRTRADFLREAYRILKPGGHLVLSDILLRTVPKKGSPYFPIENQVSDLSHYIELYRQAGFTSPTITNITRESWRAFRNHAFRWGLGKLLSGTVSPLKFIRVLVAYAFVDLYIDSYLVVSARKHT